MTLVGGEDRWRGTGGRGPRPPALASVARLGTATRWQSGVAGIGPVCGEGGLVSRRGLMFKWPGALGSWVSQAVVCHRGADSGARLYQPPQPSATSRSAAQLPVAPCQAPPGPRHGLPVPSRTLHCAHQTPLPSAGGKPLPPGRRPLPHGRGAAPPQPPHARGGGGVVYSVSSFPDVLGDFLHDAKRSFILHAKQSFINDVFRAIIP